VRGVAVGFVPGGGGVGEGSISGMLGNGEHRVVGNVDGGVMVALAAGISAGHLGGARQPLVVPGGAGGADLLL
jgi:hypothetical protein